MEAACCDGPGGAFQSDAEAACFAASLLEISEYRLFQIAHLRWYGSEASDNALRRFFYSYLGSGNVPFWLRDFVRKILRKYEEDALIPGEFGIEPQQVNDGRRKIGWVLMVFLGGLFYAYCGWLLPLAKPF